MYELLSLQLPNLKPNSFRIWIQFRKMKSLKGDIPKVNNHTSKMFDIKRIRLRF